MRMPLVRTGVSRVTLGASGNVTYRGYVSRNDAGRSPKSRMRIAAIRPVENTMTPTRN